MAAKLLHLLCAMVLLPASGHALTEAERSLQRCSQINAAHSRLRCFDETVQRYFFPSFHGDGNTRTEVFQVATPTRIRYRSEHVIFVLYLKNSGGDMIANGHQGAPGEAFLEVSEPGDYFLEVNASGKWKIWLEPLSSN